MNVMSGIVSSPDSRLSLPGLPAAEEGAADQGVLSLFEATLSRLMPSPDVAQAAPAALPAAIPAPVVVGAAASAPAAAPVLAPASASLPRAAITAASTPQTFLPASARPVDTAPLLPAAEAPVAMTAPAQVPVSARPSDAAGSATMPFRADEQTGLMAREPECADAREPSASALNIHGTLLASRLATSLPATRLETSVADSDAGADEPETVLPAVAGAAVTPQVMPLPAPPVLVPVISDRQTMPDVQRAEADMQAVRAQAVPIRPDSARPDIAQAQVAAVTARQPGPELAGVPGSRVTDAAGSSRDALPVAAAATATSIPMAPAMAQPAEASRPAAVSQPPVPLAHTPLQSPAWAHVASQRLAWMVQGGESTAVLAINPESLGPIHVRIHMDGQNARIDLAAQQPVTATLLESHLPRLTAALESQGVRVDELKVGNQALAGDFSGAQNPFSGQQAEAGGQGARQPRWMARADSVVDNPQRMTEPEPTRAASRAGGSLGQVDDFA